MQDLLPGQGGLPRYGVTALNQAIASLLERGFAPRFLLEATVSRPQLKKGHLWLTFTDGQASIQGVVWASQVARLSFLPEEGDGVLVVGKLNIWAARASLSVQVLDLRPSLSAVLRQFERVRTLLEPEGLFQAERKRPLPRWPQRLALLTSAPSSALADMLRTARERWPATAILVVPIPVQGSVEAEICRTLDQLAEHLEALGIEALVLARGGGSREDLSVFDGENLARRLAAFPKPVVTGLGHEDDTTIADLVADYRAATPTAAIVALLPEQEVVRQGLQQARRQARQLLGWRLQNSRQQVNRQGERLLLLHPHRLLEQQRQWLRHRRDLLQALSPRHLLARGFSLVRNSAGAVVRSVQEVQPGEWVEIELQDGRLRTRVDNIAPAPDQGSEHSRGMPGEPGDRP